MCFGETAVIFICYTLKEAEYEEHDNIEWRGLKTCLGVSESRRLPLLLLVSSHTTCQIRSVTVEQVGATAANHFISVVSIHTESITKCLTLGADIRFLGVS